jgi:hypothetical protein
MRSKQALVAVAATATAMLVLGTGAALAAAMNPTFGAKLTGMGEHGTVNFTSHASEGKLCWTFEVMTAGITTASIRDASGMSVAKLGPAYKAKGCTMVAKSVLTALETKPSSYRVWVDTKAHPGELRGTLRAGMVHASGM